MPRIIGIVSPAPPGPLIMRFPEAAGGSLMGPGPTPSPPTVGERRAVSLHPISRSHYSPKVLLRRLHGPEIIDFFGKIGRFNIN